MKRGSTTIRAVIFQDGNIWVAQCLEYDIGAQAPDPETVRLRLEAAIEIERRTSIEVHGSEFAGIDPAPTRFFRMWESESRTLRTRSERNSDTLSVNLALCA
jgi:hypothetical protein